MNIKAPPTIKVADIPGLPARARDAFRRFGISTLGDLIKIPAEDLLKLPNFGHRTLAGVNRAVNALGLQAVEICGACGGVGDVTGMYAAGGQTTTWRRCPGCSHEWQQKAPSHA